MLRVVCMSAARCGSRVSVSAGGAGASARRSFGALSARGLPLNPETTPGISARAMSTAPAANTNVKASQVPSTSSSAVAASGAAGKELLRTPNFTLSLLDSVAILTFDTPNAKMNTLGESVLEDIPRMLQEIEGNPEIRGVVFMSGKIKSWIAGADIQMLDRVKTEEDGAHIAKTGQQMMNRLESCGKPIVAAISGACMGGGLETALACHYRIALNHPSTKIGVPEVLLGLLPGSGGTYRIPRLPGMDLASALDLMLTGRAINAIKAKKMGVIDAVVEPLGPGLADGDQQSLDFLRHSAVLTVKAMLAGKIKKTVLGENKTWKQWFMGQNRVVRYITKTAMARVSKPPLNNYPAPPKIIKLLEDTLVYDTASLVKALSHEREARAFGQLCVSTESKALIGLFNGQNECKKNKFGTPQRDPKQVCVLGAGLMGAGVAEVSVDKAGISGVYLKDLSLPTLAKGQTQIYQGIDKQAKRKKISTFERDVIMSKLGVSTGWEGFSGADIVVEAVFEDLALKHKVLKEVEAHIPEHCIFASNTSALPIAHIAQASKRPEKVIGMHYFSPVPKMPLLEIVTTDKTSKDTTASAVALGLKQGKTVIVVKDGPGFYTTRVLAPIMSEALRLLQEGVGVETLDKVSKAMGLPVGCITLIDEVGIDVAAHISEHLGGVFKERFEGGDPALLKEMVSRNFLGRKSGRGFYVFGESRGKSTRTVNTEALELIKQYSITPKGTLSEEEMRNRLLLRFVNEAVWCLQQEILPSPVEGDIGAVFGLGFPPFLGGPFRYIDTQGADRVAEKLSKLQAVYGASFAPAPLLLDHAKHNSKFHSK